MRIRQRVVLSLGILLLTSGAAAQVDCTPDPSPAKYTVEPSNVAVMPSGSTQFSLQPSPGTPVPPFHFIVQPIDGIDKGTMSPSGSYTAPDNTRSTTWICVLAVKEGSGEVLSKAKVPIVTQPITVFPAMATMNSKSATQQFIAYTITPMLLKWQVNKIDGGSTVVGLVNKDTGLYSAPDNEQDAGTFTLAAVSKDNPKLFGTAAVVFVSLPCDKPPCLEIVAADHPTAVLTSYVLGGHESVKFAVHTSDGKPLPANSLVNWSIVDKNKSKATGRIIAHGQSATYKPPDTQAGTSIQLTAKADRSGYDSATLNVIVAPVVLLPCFRGDVRVVSGCTIINFDRLKHDTGLYPARTKGITDALVDANTDAGVVTAINGAKTVFSGSVIDAHLTGDANASNCGNFDWKIAVQTEESAGVFVYNPSDVGSGVCEGSDFIVAVPLHVLWAQVYGYPQVLDPERSAPAKPTSYTDCAGQPSAQTIAPCDYNSTWPLTRLYGLRSIYNHFTPPGNGQGTISFTGTGQVVFDIQADPAYKAGPGWLSTPVLFERGPSMSNLNSLTLLLAYDFRFVARPDIRGPEADRRFIVRKPQFQIRSGIEMSPDRPGSVNVMNTDNNHDWNYISGEVVRLPFVFNIHNQPSSVTFYPVVGAEQGWHISNNITEKNPIARGVAGVDGSVRFPFLTTRNILGGTPITFEAQYRVRWLAYPEPIADFADATKIPLMPPPAPPHCPTTAGLINTGTNCAAAERLSTKPRTYFRSALSFPINPFISITASFTRGSLPPDFWLIGNTYSLGFQFANTASAEH
jgi:hypothetical protein